MINTAMTLRELIGKYTLAELMPHLKGHGCNEQANAEQYLYMQAWSELQHLAQLTPEEITRLYRRDLSDIIPPKSLFGYTWRLTRQMSLLTSRHTTAKGIIGQA